MNMHPLSKIDLSQLKKAAALAADAAFKCAKAIESGVDMGEELPRCQHLQASIQQLLDVYDNGKNWKFPETNANAAGSS